MRLSCVVFASAVAFWSVSTVSSLPVLLQADRPAPPARDPHSPGYAAAMELPDGTVPSPKADGNFIIGPTHNAASELASPTAALQGTVVEFTMNSADSKIYPGIERTPNT